MKEMTVERLYDLYYIKKHIERIDNEIMRLAINAGPSGYRSPNISGMPRNPSPINKSDLALDEIQKLNNEKQSLQIEIEEIENWIHSLRRKDQLIVRYRYEDRLSWQEIADIIGGKETIDSIKSAHYRCLKANL
ncbi:MAG: hypothetical protein IK093_17785 [Ruminiclostridium sp.]|nr:hypothetical protein [Ruminiclostridium sp.]